MTRRTTTRRARASATEAAEATAPTPSFTTIGVRVGRLPGVIQNVVLDGGRKVRDALAGAELDHVGYEIRVNSGEATLETDLKDDDTVLLVRKVRGNR